MTDPVAEARALLAHATAREWSLHRGYDGITMDSEMSDSDAAFIAATPRLLAALADEVERLRTDVRSACQDLEDAESENVRLRAVADAARSGDDVALMDALNALDEIAGDGG